jgi:capsular polysaccharide export protein
MLWCNPHRLKTEGLLQTPRFQARPRRISTMTRTGAGSVAEALAAPLPAAVQAEALALARRLVHEQLGGTFWAPPPAPDCLRQGRVIVLAGPDRAASHARFQTALAHTGEAGRLVLLMTRPDPSLRREAAGHGAAIQAGPVDPWPLLSGAEAIYADGATRFAMLARLAGVPFHGAGPAAAGSDGAFAAAVLLLGSRYADPFTGARITCAAALDVAAEWRRVTTANRRIGACTGMSFWKRRRMRALLHDGERAPPHRATARGAVHAARPRAVAAWSSRHPPHLAERCGTAGIGLLRVEDGFIRSRGLGSGFLPPCSIIADASGIYYDPSRPSDLETMLLQTAFAPALLGRARALARRLVAEGITKYGAGATALALPPRDGRRRILVPGQVADDLSVVHGGAGIAGNLALLARVRAANPDGFIIYKPHPDVEAGHRAGWISDESAAAHADLIAKQAPIIALIEAADEVHVLTSLAGFEALLRGRKVVTYGQPFYAGWGLTEDHAPVARRCRRLTLDELCAATLLLYPRYIDPVTELPCGPELLLDRLAEPALWRPTLLMRLRQLQGQMRLWLRPRRQPGLV